MWQRVRQLKCAWYSFSIIRRYKTLHQRRYIRIFRFEHFFKKKKKNTKYFNFLRWQQAKKEETFVRRRVDKREYYSFLFCLCHLFCFFNCRFLVCYRNLLKAKNRQILWNKQVQIQHLSIRSTNQLLMLNRVSISIFME